MVDYFVNSSMLNHMVEQQVSSLDSVFHALADPTRRAMLRDLAAGEKKIGELAAPFDMSFAAASKHVKVLERAGLLHRRVVGRTHLCRIEALPLQAAEGWLRFYERFWTDRLDALDDLLRAEDHARGAHPNKKEGHDCSGKPYRSRDPAVQRIGRAVVRCLARSDQGGTVAFRNVVRRDGAA